MEEKFLKLVEQALRINLSEFRKIRAPRRLAHYLFYFVLLPLMVFSGLSSIAKNIDKIAPYTLIGGVIIGLILEPKQPKVDRRFKTGYKDNATHKSKGVIETRVQLVAWAIATLSLVAVLLKQ